MNRAIQVGGLLLCALLAHVSGASAGHPTVQFGPTVIDKPGHHSRFGYKPSTSRQSVPTLGHPHLPPACRIYRGEYRLRHVTRPSSLRAFHGCKLWRLDHLYHSRLNALESARAMSSDPIARLITSIEIALLGHE